MSEVDTALLREAEAEVETPGSSSFQAPAVRAWITLSYWTIILLCVPYWWHSTTIERHALPLERIEQWQNRGPCPIQLPVSIAVISHDPTQAGDLTDSLNRDSRDADRCIVFKTSSGTSFSDYHITLKPAKRSFVQLRGNQSANVHYTDDDNAYARVGDLFMPSPERYGLPRTPYSQGPKAVKYAGKYKLVFSLLNEDVSKGGIARWDANMALEHHIYPILRSLSTLHSYDVETQVQYYAPLVVQREVMHDVAYIAEDQLKVFVNSAEWNLASSVSSDPVLHFILYVPANDKRPLYLKRSDNTVEPLTFFSIPQWGGVVVHDPDQLEGSKPGTANTLLYEDLQPAFAQFASLLRASLGVPMMDGIIESSMDKENWEVQALMRERIMQNVQDAIQKLGAIARQANEIQNMRIPRAVQKDVKDALDALALVQSENVNEAMQQSAIASSLATRASFNHEMLAMLYFPDEHKWAVYTPLFGPIVVPLLVALVREIKELRKRRRDKVKRE